MQNQLNRLKQLLTEYAVGYRCGDTEIDRNIDLKRDHSLRVLAEAEKICVAENFPDPVARCACYGALLHDLSRFEQFRRFRSFDDRRSFDHGDRSAVLLEELHWLEALPPEEVEAVIAAVKWHNKIALPETFSGDRLRIAQVVRDADKLDIMTVLRRELDNPAVFFSLKDRIGVLSPAIAAALSRGRPARHADMRNATDFLAAKFQWAHELCFRRTKELFLERDDLGFLRSKLPPSAEINRLYDIAMENLKS